MTGIPQKTITMKIKEGLTLNEKKKSEIMAKDFKNIFYANATPIQNVFITNIDVNTIHIIRNK